MAKLVLNGETYCTDKATATEIRRILATKPETASREVEAAIADMGLANGRIRRVSNG